MPSIINQLIERLPRQDRTRLLAVCEPYELIFSDILIDSGTAARYVYFPTGGFISLVTPLDGKPALEVGMIGAEGMLGIQVALGVSATPLKALVQGAGTAWRVPVTAFKRELASSAALVQTLNRYVHVCMLQLASMSACARYHDINPRLARWLLMMHDRAERDTFQVTQEFLAYMLGVRRVGVTAAAMALKQEGLISYRRGNLAILDRRALEVAACSCYASDLRTYRAHLG